LGGFRVLTAKYRKALWMGRGVVRRFELPLRRVAKRSPMIVKARDELVERYHNVLLRGAEVRKRLLGNDPSARAGGVNPENMIWIFSTSRSGSSWLRSMMAELEGHRVWEEPSVGRLFGDFYRRAQRRQFASPDFIMGNPTRKGWIRLIRDFILGGAGYAHPFLNSGHYLVIKEPDSAAGAPLIMEALPESRMIFLLRDPRDIVASSLDATRKGSWMYEAVDRATWKEKELANRQPDNFARTRANSYLRQIGSIRDAYNAHRGRRVLVRYEDLRADTLGTMKRIYSALEIPVQEERLVRAVERHSWESIPEKEKGEGKFYRKGTPGGWREDLTPNQVEIVESITAPLLREFYP
jgi:sulfotransferase family protein